MKTRLLIFALSFLTIVVTAQKNHGINWVGGSLYSDKINFAYTPPTIIPYKEPLYLTAGASCISDTTGKLRLVCNGYSLLDSAGHYIEGGDTITPSALCKFYDGFSPFSQSSIILPFKDDIYITITGTASDSEFVRNWMANNPYRSFCSFDMLLYTKVDMKMNNGMGKVVAKAVPIETDGLFQRTGMMACRHADGINWWLLKQGKNDNIIYKYLVTQDSVYKMGTQVFAQPKWGCCWDYKGQLMFNSQGTQLAQVVYGSRKLFIANFDRCSGEISYPKIYDLPSYNKWDSLYELDTMFTGVCFSPNDSMVYVSSNCNIVQLDLYDTESASPWYRVANLDTTWSKFSYYCGLHNGPDGKIYIGNWSWAKAWSVINDPNKKGGACDFLPKHIRFRGTHNPPTMPNYALGKDTSQPCTPLGEVTYTEQKVALLVYPNPADKDINITYNFEGDDDAVFQLFDVLGRMQLQTTLPNKLNQIQLHLNSLQPGFYSYRVTSGKQQFYGKLLIK
jgi:hypothetical protein